MNYVTLVGRVADYLYQGEKRYLWQPPHRIVEKRAWGGLFEKDVELERNTTNAQEYSTILRDFSTVVLRSFKRGIWRYPDSGSQKSELPKEVKSTSW